MTKIQILDKTGKQAKQIDTNIFDGKIRDDIVSKIIETEKISQEHAPYFNAGMQTSASGNVRHLRHSWKTDRGTGSSRVPKKRMSRRGARFHWIAAVVPGVRGGRRAHPPKLGGKLTKINKKELKVGVKSALAMVASLNLVKEKYNSLKDTDLKVKLPFVIESNVLELKTKDFIAFIKKVLNEFESVAIQKKTIRAGKGKLRGRKYKKNAGMLLVIGNQENKKINAVDVKNVEDLMITDLAAGGPRVVMFSEAAIKDIENKLEGKKQ